MYSSGESSLQLININDKTGLEKLEQKCLAQNANYKNWECTEEKIKLTRNGEALYMHCLPADISGISCKEGEVEASVFEKYRIETYKEAGYKPYIIASMIMNNRFEKPDKILEKLITEKKQRKF